MGSIANIEPAVEANEMKAYIEKDSKTGSSEKKTENEEEDDGNSFLDNIYL